MGGEIVDQPPPSLLCFQCLVAGVGRCRHEHIGADRDADLLLLNAGLQRRLLGRS